jgi:lysophospholipase L1-like esterase
MFSRSAALFALAFVAFGVHATTPATAQSWINTWTASPQSSAGGMPVTYSNQTVRQIVHVSIGGSRVRIRLSNEFGSHPVLIAAASVGVAGIGPEVVPGSLRPLTFGGSKSIILPPGAPIISDPAELDIAPLSEVVVSLYLPSVTEPETVHQVGLQTAYVSTAGDLTTMSNFSAVDTFNNRLFLAGLMVETTSSARAIVAFGDSITDGTRSTANTNNRWPDILARRMKDAGRPIAVLNEAISGNRLLSDGAGVSALARFERDVLSQPGVSHVVILLGINDIGTQFEPRGVVRIADEIIAGYKQLIERAHVRSIKVIGSPLTPFENAAYFSPDKEAVRRAVNNWIRTSGAFDGIIDFEHVIADPAHRSAIASAYDSGDHLHPNDAGYKAMAEAIDLKLFQ